MSAENKAAFRRWFDEVWNKGRVDAIDEMLTADVIVHGVGPDLVGPEGFKPFHRAYRDAFPDVTIHVDLLVAEGDLVAGSWHATGTHKGDGLGFAATGRPAQFSGMTIMRFANGKLAEGWNSFDQLGMLQQLGIVSHPR